LGGCEQDAEQRVVVREHLVLSGIPIETAEELAGIGIGEGYPADGEYYLTGDIDLSPLWEVGEDDPPYVWRSIGSTCRECGGPLLPASKTTHVLPLRCENRDCALYLETQTPFSGILHGNGYAISGLKLPGTLPTGTVSGYEEALYFGLFGYISTAYIHDVTVRVANTDEDRAAYSSASVGTVAEQPSFGVLAGLARGSRIVSVHIEADADSAGTGLYVSGPVSTTTASTYIGGVIGKGIDTFLIDNASSVPLNVDGKGNEFIGGIAGTLTGEIRNAEVTGNITAASVGTTTVVAGICTYANLIRDCAVTMDALTLTLAATTGSPTLALAGIGYGSSAVTDCDVEIKQIKVEGKDTTTTGRAFYIGGISASTIPTYAGISSLMEGNHVTFDKLEVSLGATVRYNTVYIGGIAGFMLDNTGTVSNCSVEGDGEITVNLPYASAYPPSVGGIAGRGSVSHCRIPGGLKIHITTGAAGGVSAGGLTGNGVAEYSFIGSKDKHAELTVEETNTTLLDYYSYYTTILVGGISGQVLNPTRPFQRNYAFCDVTLDTAAGIQNTTEGQAVGGLVGGFFASSGTSFTESYAAGSITLTYDYTGGSDSAPVCAAGIAARTSNNANLTISKCAALNSTVVINGTSTAKKWRRIAYPDSDGTNTVFTNNIAKIGGTPPAGYSPTDGANEQDGLAVASVTESTFFGPETGQLGWSRDVWDWDGSYPVLK
jgi:hypothetical protein